MTRFLTAILIIWNTCIIGNGLLKCRNNLFGIEAVRSPGILILKLSMTGRADFVFRYYKKLKYNCDKDNNV